MASLPEYNSQAFPRHEHRLVALPEKTGSGFLRANGPVLCVFFSCVLPLLAGMVSRAGASSPESVLTETLSGDSREFRLADGVISEEEDLLLFTLSDEVMGRSPDSFLYGSSFEVALPQGPVVRGLVEIFEETRSGGLLWGGHFPSFGGSWFHLVTGDGVAAGEISVPGFGHYHLRWDGNGFHSLRRVPSEERLRCLGAPPRSSEENRGGEEGDEERDEESVIGRGETCSLGSPRLIDVLFAYTPSSRATVGGSAAMETVLESHIAYTNRAYAESGVNPRVRMVHSFEIAYVESGNALTDLARIKNPSDGIMDEIHGIRDQFGADLVCLINTSGSAGTAFRMDVLSTTFEDRAFSAIGATVGGIVFAHEAGHNMGCDHNHPPGVPDTIFCYSYGHRTADDRFRTIMSNSPGEFVDFFSAPDLEVNGMALGVSGDGCPPDAAHNVRSINNAADTVSRFRPTQVPEEPEVLCRFGNVNAGAGSVRDVLFVNGMAGQGFERELVLGSSDPFKISMALPPSKSSEARFVLYVFLGSPTAETVRTLPQGVGTFCRESPLTDGPGDLRLLKAIFNNRGRFPLLGTPTHPSIPAPSDVLCLPNGVQRNDLTFFLQGLIDDDDSCHGRIAVTNGIVVRIP